MIGWRARGGFLVPPGNPTVELEMMQIPPDFVVKSQAIDSTEVILSLIRRPKVVQTLHRNRKSRLELLFISETHRSTTKSDGMCEKGGYAHQPIVSTLASRRSLTDMRTTCRV